MLKCTSVGEGGGDVEMYLFVNTVVERLSRVVAAGEMACVRSIPGRSISRGCIQSVAFNFD